MILYKIDGSLLNYEELGLFLENNPNQEPHFYELSLRLCQILKICVL